LPLERLEKQMWQKNNGKQGNQKRNQRASTEEKTFQGSKKDFCAVDPKSVDKKTKDSNKSMQRSRPSKGEGNGVGDKEGLETTKTRLKSNGPSGEVF